MPATLPRRGAQAAGPHNPSQPQGPAENSRVRRLVESHIRLLLPIINVQRVFDLRPIVPLYRQLLLTQLERSGDFDAPYDPHKYRSGIVGQPLDELASERREVEAR